ncbi:MAG: selenocysteine-specific translation elongation factor [Chloroflexota bacterium]
MYVIGTAGHVDHGKSTLVQALTGIDPDRLSEEKAREMTIDLGFAWVKLPGIEQEIGVVDVPGHRDFIENMLAGVGGIDLALLVVAADEGVMPQTAEHLSILNLLKVKGGIVVLTKVDMIDDPDWLELIELELAETLEGTVLEGADILSVSAKTGLGMNDLKKAIAQKLEQVSKRQDSGRARLPIDRVFSLSGFGTVVTGTLLGGSLAIGDMIELQPSGHSGRVRGLQSHKTKREVVEPGSRVAVNITGIDRNEVKRGDVLAGVNVLRGTTLVDVSYDHLDSAALPLKHNAEVKFFVGSKEVLARARVLGKEEIGSGESGWVQFALKEPIAVLRNDRYIIRRPSPAATIGGGQILDPFPGRQHRRFRDDVIDRLKTLEIGTPGDLLLQKLSGVDPINLQKFKRQSGLEEGQFDAALQELLGDERALLLEKQLISEVKFRKFIEEMKRLVHRFHVEQPLRLGIQLEEARSRLKIPGPVFSFVVQQSELVQDGSVIRESDHVVEFTSAQKHKIDGLMSRFNRSGINSPSVKDAKGEVGEDLYFTLVDLGELRQISDDVVYIQETYEEIRAEVIQYLSEHQEINAGQMRDLFQTSRKYAIGFLEHLDQIKITRRDGDVRRLIRST